MRDAYFTWVTKGALMLGWALCLSGSMIHAQDAASSGNNSNNDWQRYDWLKPVETQERQAASGSTLNATVGQDISNPFAVLSTGSLWQEKYGATYKQQVADTLSLSYETDAIKLSDGSNPYLPLSDGSEDLSRGQKAGLQFQPMQALTLDGNVHDSTSDSILPEDSVTTTGAGFTAVGHLPFNSVLTFGVDSGQTDAGTIPGGATTHYTSYDAQFQQPLGKMPVTAVFKSHYDQTTTAGALTTSQPTMEQSLVWKPVQDTTVQMGLRQQHYQNFPGMSSDFNEALFADWSQKVLPDVTWHSYAEVLDARSNLDLAPGVSTTSGVNGTPQPSTPGGPSVSSAVPLIAEDKTLTFSTGPSFQLKKNISASVEYSNRWDQNPLPGSVGQEQRVSISLKGSF
jgi:hypothetical protein